MALPDVLRKSPRIEDSGLHQHDVTEESFSVSCRPYENVSPSPHFSEALNTKSPLSPGGFFS